MHAVRDVADRDLVLAVVRPQHLPRLARDAPVQRGDAVRVARHLERQHRHAQRLAVVLGPDAPEAEELVLRQAQRAAQRLEVIVDQLGREAIVAGVDRRVGREHRALRDLLRAGPEVGAGQLHEQARVLQRRERAVPLVQVQPAPVDAGRAQRAHAAHAQQQLLADADALVAEVEPGGELAVLLGVPVDVGVEQEQLVAADGDLPDLRAQRLARQRDLDDDRLAGRGQRRAWRAAAPRASGRIRRAASRRGRCAGGSTTRGRTGRPPPAAAQIGRALEVVAREHAEAAGIDRAATRGCRTPPKNRRPGGRAAGRRGPSPRCAPRPGSRAARGRRCRPAPAGRRHAPDRRSAPGRSPPAPRRDCGSRPGSASGSRSRNSLMMCGFQAHHRLRDSSVSWLMSFSPVVMGATLSRLSVGVAHRRETWL